MNPKVDEFLDQAGKWQEEYKELRKVCLDCGLEEGFKWGKPSYSHKGSNIVLIHGFKAYCALLFHKGVLLKDPEGILVQQTENVQSARQLRFTSVDEIKKQKPIIKAYIFEAVEAEKTGLKVEFKKTKDFDIPEEFQKKMDQDAELKAAFEKLTPGRQRGYLLYFSKAKKSETRERRIEKCREKIFEGKGWNER